MTNEDRKVAFLKDFEELLKKHNAIIDVERQYMKSTHHDEDVLHVWLPETDQLPSTEFYMLSAMEGNCKEDI